MFRCSNCGSVASHADRLDHFQSCREAVVVEWIAADLKADHEERRTRAAERQAEAIEVAAKAMTALGLAVVRLVDLAERAEKDAP